VPAAAPPPELHEEDLALLESADPPLQIPADGLLFFFSADCDHCWSYAGGVQMAQDRLQDFQVLGVTFSEDYALAEFREFFAPTYSIYRISQRAFLELMPDFPGAVWIQNGRLAHTWGGYVPSHREIAELGGYDLVEPADVSSPVVPSGAGGLFGGPATERH
jgi:hypothetical protein